MSHEILHSDEVKQFIANRGPATYYLWCEHCNGQSISHPCTKGVWSDPSDGWSTEIEAASEEEALNKGAAEFDKYFAELADSDGLTERCQCQRKLFAGSNSWWSSLMFTASLKPFPDYFGDEMQAEGNTTEQIEVVDHPIQIDRSGVGHCWQAADEID